VTPSRHGGTVAVVVLGLPGAGKGTQSARLSRALAVPHVATGDLIRATINAGGPHAAVLSERMGRGELVPDWVTLELLIGRLNFRDAADGFVLDGYPRNRSQAETLEREVARRGFSGVRAIHLDVALPVLVQRLSGRRICSAVGHPYHLTEHPPRDPGHCDVDGSALIQRADDDAEVVERRLELQRDGLADVVHFYRDQGRLRVVDGEASVSRVADAILAAIRGREVLPDWISPTNGWILGHVSETGERAEGELSG
jgi:adenylate kinase